MSNDEDKIYARLWKLYIMVGKMIIDGKRDPQKVADALQVIVDKTNAYLRRLFKEEVIKVGSKVFTIYEMIKDGTLIQAFESLGDLNHICFSSREEVDRFCHVHHDKLRGGGYPTFFLYVKGGELFVVDVLVDCDKHLRVYEFLFKLRVHVLNAKCRYRFVVPQQ